MQKIIILFCAALICCVSCKKGNDKNENAANTWSLSLEGYEPSIYSMKSISLSTNIYQLLQAESLEQPRATYGINSTIKLYFATVGPPPSGVYKVTSFEKLSGHPDCVAIQNQTFGDQRTGSSHTVWFSQEGSTQQISYEFKDGKASATFKDIIMKQSGTGPKTGTLSARISQ